MGAPGAWSYGAGWVGKGHPVRVPEVGVILIIGLKALQLVDGPLLNGLLRVVPSVVEGCDGPLQNMLEVLLHEVVVRGLHPLLMVAKMHMKCSRERDIYIYIYK